jgi:hypothetical protein
MGDATVGPWTLYSERRPTHEMPYEWRVASKAVEGLTLIVAAWMRTRWAGYSEALSPVFDYWDGYRLNVESPVEWRETEGHNDLKRHDIKIIEVEGFKPCACIYCGKVPTLKAEARARDGGLWCSPPPWNLNSWRLVCCQWGSSPWMDDPRKIEEKRREAFARARGETPEVVRIVEKLAALSDGLNNSNSSAEEAASRLADEAKKIVAETADRSWTHPHPHQYRRRSL